jgi:thiamine-phosphate pyrophosphorylase
VIRCLITDGTFSRNPPGWMEHIAYWIAEHVEVVQIRERDLSARDLAELTRQVLALRHGHATKVLVNDRADVALACGADGVHLRDRSVDPEKFRRPDFLVSVSCHNVNDAEKLAGASFIVLAPIFQPLSKAAQGPALGVSAIREFTRRSAVPVLALGGITDQNARTCIDAGAVGIAGITYFSR